MFSILRKTTASSARSSGGSTSHEQNEVFVDELTAWEFVNSSLTDNEDLYSFNGDDVESESKAELEEEETRGACESRDAGPPDDVMCLRSLSVSPPMILPVEATPHHPRHDDDEEEEEDEEREVDEEENDVYDDDVDDDLVPWELKGRFGKQRIMKMGKRLGPKPNRSNKLPCYYHNRPKSFYEKGILASA